MGQVEKELRGKLWEVAGPGWVKHEPKEIGELCLVVRVISEWDRAWLSQETWNWLAKFIATYDYPDPVYSVSREIVSEFNDIHTREQNIWMLEEAIDQAEWEGV